MHPPRNRYLLWGGFLAARRTRGLIRELIIMTILILGLLYAILMISVGVNEIYFYSTGKSNFLTSLMLTFSGSMLLIAVVWQLSSKIKK
ncbi:hypothetical protein P9A09_05170 [Serratia marcescens]|nr:MULTISPECIES: hypothetical protein [Serratia]MCF1216660.1 hypothetical protein [Serratia marcescens]MCF1319184.1 hypothetical protein [Serratia marcescens]MCF1323938.1 hypothetical protein [Serratia marcescens]MCF1608313.1 hypothetical protein [Serratia marcescens]MCG5372659.1 hypothetical protein [Serratia marcescens]